MQAILSPERSNCISMEVADWEHGQTEQFSAVYHISGYLWRLRLLKTNDDMQVMLICDKSNEAELWECSATVSMAHKPMTEITHKFASWNADFPANITSMNINSIRHVKLYIVAIHRGRRWTLRSSLTPFELLDGVLVIGEDILEVNIHSLSSQSPYFKENFRNGQIREIAIGDVGFEEFSNIYKMIYGFSGASLTDDNVHRVMEMAEKFELKIVKYRVVTFLLSKASTLPLQARLLFSHHFKVPLLKHLIFPDEKSLDNLDEWEDLSFETLRVLFLRSVTGKPTERRRFPDFINLSMVVEQWQTDQKEQLSPIYLFNEIPWRLRLYKGDFPGERLELIFEKSPKVVFWECTAEVTWNKDTSDKQVFTSEKQVNWKLQGMHKFEIGSHVEVEITVYSMLSYSPRILDCVDSNDGFIVFGEENKKVAVNKKSLAAESPFFDRLFFGDFMEKNMSEIPIGDVEYEEFANIIKIIYGFDGDSLTEMNSHRILELADRFELKIVEDGVVYVLLASKSHSIHEKLVISDQFNLTFLKDYLISRKYTHKLLKELCKSPHWEELSKGTIRVLFKKFCFR